VMLFDNSDMQIRNYQVDSKSFFKNRTITDIRKKININIKFLIAGIIRDNDFLIPSGSTVIMENDIVYILASKNTLTRLFIETGKKSEKIDSILIAGGGKIGALAAKYLLRTGRKVTILDPDYEKCKTLAEDFPSALVLNADVSDETIFEEENLSSCDLLITATGNQELNILSAAYGKSLGISRAVAVVNHPNYMAISSRLGIDVTVSPRNSTVSAIMKFLRKGDIKSVHTLFGDSAEIIEFNITGKSSLDGLPLKDIATPPNSLILTVVRNNINEIPDGNFTIKSGDRVITIAKRESIHALEMVFSGR